MRHTEHYEFPLYDPDSAPDLTETGQSDQAFVKADETIYEEATARQQADEAEAEAREVADTDLSKQIASEATARQQADEAEAEAREVADTDLSKQIASEATARQQADEAEAEAREVADKELDGRISQEALARSAADNAETMERTEADKAITSTVNGIMSLTYGADNDPLAKVTDNVYTSPALEKIAKQFEESGGAGFTVIEANKPLTEAEVTLLKTDIAHACVLVNNIPCFYATADVGYTFQSGIRDFTSEEDALKRTISVVQYVDPSTLTAGSSLNGYTTDRYTLSIGKGLIFHEDTLYNTGIVVSTVANSLGVGTSVVLNVDPEVLHNPLTTYSALVTTKASSIKLTAWMRGTYRSVDSDLGYVELKRTYMDTSTTSGETTVYHDHAQILLDFTGSKPTATLTSNGIRVGYSGSTVSSATLNNISANSLRIMYNPVY